MGVEAVVIVIATDDEIRVVSGGIAITSDAATDDEVDAIDVDRMTNKTRWIRLPILTCLGTCSPPSPHSSMLKPLLSIAVVGGQAGLRSPEVPRQEQTSQHPDPCFNSALIPILALCCA